MALTKILQEGIKDGEIVNADINASAAIATSKISGLATSATTDTTNASNIGSGSLANARLTKPIDFADNEKARFGTGNDLEIYHDSTAGHSYIKESGTGSLLIQAQNFFVQNPAGTETMIHAVPDGTVELYWNGTKKFETLNTGVRIPDDMSYQVGNGADLQIFHNQTDNFIRTLNGKIYIDGIGGEQMITAIPDGAVELYCDGSKKFETNASGASLIDSDNTVSFGLLTSNGQAGYLTGISNDTLLIQSGTGENMAGFNKDGSVDLYYNNSKKLETTNSGGTLYGDWLADANFLLADNDKIKLGNGADLTLHHDGSHSYIDNEVGSLKIRDTGGVTKITVNGYGTTLSNATDNAAMNDCLLLTRRGYEASGYGTKVQAMGGSVDSQNGIQFAHSHTNGAGYTVRQRFDHDGIKFNGDTASANALDDYEEGTFTPLMGGSNYGSYNITGSGKYTKIGRMVHFQLQFVNQNLDDNANGDMRIRGWPYAWSTTSARPVVPVVMMYNVTMPDDGNTNPSTYALYGDADGISMYGIVSHDGTDWNAWSINAWEYHTTYFDLNGFYMTA